MRENWSDTGLRQYHPREHGVDGNRPFGDFLRSRRTRLMPDGPGKAARQRRRTPGLKREEVAQRAGISAEW